MNTRNARQSDSKASGSGVTGKRKQTGGIKSAPRNKATGKKDNASSTLDLEINEENMAFYKAMQARLKAEKKSAAASQDEGKLL
jgi:hypothetical protein